MKTLWKRTPAGWQKEFHFHSPVHACVWLLILTAGSTLDRQV